MLIKELIADLPAQRLAFQVYYIALRIPGEHQPYRPWRYTGPV